MHDTPPLDLERSDAEIRAETQRLCRADPTFQPIAEWRCAFAQRHASTHSQA